jgi:hypothetical protein
MDNYVKKVGQTVLFGLAIVIVFWLVRGLV